jgi:hypothetical protein
LPEVSPQCPPLEGGNKNWLLPACSQCLSAKPPPRFDKLICSAVIHYKPFRVIRPVVLCLLDQKKWSNTQKQKFQNTLLADKYLPRPTACASAELILVSHLVHSKENPGVLKERIKAILLSIRLGTSITVTARSKA